MTLLEVKNLSVFYKVYGKKIAALKNISFSLKQNEKLGIIGETGSGKSTLLQALLKLIPEVSGEVYYQGEDLLKKQEKELQLIRGKEIGIAFQSSSSSLNPTMTVAAQIAEMLHSTETPHDLLEEVALPSLFLNSYPHQLSGGMKQRAQLAIALAKKPKLFLADEVTSALDPFTKEKIIALLKKQSSLIFVTHDLDAISEVCDQVLVFQNGEIKDMGPTDSLLRAYS